MILRRTGQADLPVQGALNSYRPEAVPVGGQAGDVKQGDGVVNLLNDEIAAASWPAPVRRTDTLAIDGRTWAVMGAVPVYDGSALIGWTIWVRGGQT